MRHRKAVRYFVLIAIFGLALDCAGQPIGMVNRELSFTYAGPRPRASDSDVRDATLAASAIYQVKNCTNDVPCGINLTNARAVAHFPHPGRITGLNEILAIQRATRARVILADRISQSACPDRLEPVAGPGRILGCADLTIGSWLVVVRDPSRMGITLAHEFGHASGLPHRTASCALMNPVYAPGNKALDGWECRQLKDPLTNPPRTAPNLAKGKANAKAKANGGKSLKLQKSLRDWLVNTNMRDSQ